MGSTSENEKLESNLFNFVNRKIRDNVFHNLQGVIDEIDEANPEALNKFWNESYKSPKADGSSDFKFSVSKKSLQCGESMILFEFPLVKSLEENYFFGAAIYNANELNDNIRYFKLEDREGHSNPVVCEWRYNKKKGGAGGAYLHNPTDVESKPEIAEFVKAIENLAQSRGS